MGNDQDEDFIPDYGLPPRTPSPSLLQSNVSYPSSFLSPLNLDIPAFPDKKKKKKGDPEPDVYDIDDDDEIVEIKQEIKEEPVTYVNLSEEEVDDGEIEVVGVTTEDPKARRERWRNKQRNRLKNKSNASNLPMQGTSSSFINANNNEPARRPSSQSCQSQGQGEVSLSSSTGSLPSAPTTGSEDHSGQNITRSNSVATTSSLASTVEARDQQHPNVNGTRPPQPTATQEATPNLATEAGTGTTENSFGHTTINLNIEMGSSCLVNVPGQPQLKITAIPADNITLRSVPPPPSPVPPPPPRPSSMNLKDSDCQTGKSVINGLPFTRRKNIDLTQPHNQNRSVSPASDCTSSTTSQTGPPVPITADGAVAAAAAVHLGSTKRTTNNSNQNSTWIGEREKDSSRRHRSRSPPRHRHRSDRHKRRSRSRSASKSTSRSRSRSPSSPRAKTRHPTQPPNEDSASPKLFRTGRELLNVIRNCTICKIKCATRADGVAHQKKIHSKKFCPVCFKLLSRQGNAWKDHITSRHLIRDKDDVEMVKCPLCKKTCEFEGLYQHIGVKHLLNLESPSKNRKGLPPAPIIPPAACTVTRPTAPANGPVVATTAERATVTNKNIASGSGSQSKSTTTPTRSTTTSQSTPTNSKTQGTSFTTPKIVSTHGASTQRPLPATTSTSQQPSRDVGDVDADDTSNSEMDEVVGAIHTAYLNNVYNNHNGIPDALDIERISNKLGVVSRSITVWFVRKHQQQKQSQKRGIQSMFNKTKKKR